MSENKKKSERVAQYLVSKTGAKYLKFGAKPNAPKEVHDRVAALIKANGGNEVMFINLFDAEFKAKHNIADFVKGSIDVAMDATSSSPGKKSGNDDGVNF